jgi:hypothetical protein
MTVRANQLQVFFSVVKRISVYVIHFKRDFIRHRMPFAPTAKTTFFAKLFEQISLEVF